MHVYITAVSANILYAVHRRLNNSQVTVKTDVWEKDEKYKVKKKFMRNSLS